MEIALIVLAAGVLALAGVCVRLQTGRARAESEGATARGAAERFASELSAAQVQLAQSREEIERLRERAQGLEVMLAQREKELESAAAMHRQELEGIHAQHAERVGAFERERQRFEQQVTQLKETFQSLASQTLKGVSDELLKRAGETFEARGKQAQLELDKRAQAVEQMVRPIGETLGRAQQQLAALTARIDESRHVSEGLRHETAKLTRALSRPEVRGRYGEIQLRRVAELAGMTGYCDFCEQASSRDMEGNLLRPDMVVRLPNDRVIAVDAKANVDAYVQAASATTEEEQAQCLARFADHIEGQVRKLAEKRYWAQFDSSPEFVVMFVPGDQFLDAALVRKPNLLDMAAERNVILASPSTLIGLLRAVAVGWREHKLAEDAAQLFELGRQLHDRMRVALEYASKVGSSLEKAVKDYNGFVGSVESRLMPTIRKFEESDVRSAKEVPELEKITVRSREMVGLDGTRALLE